MNLHSSSQPLAQTGIDLQLQAAISSVAAHFVAALEVPLRAHIEASVQALVQEATKDIHTRIAAAIGQIPAIHIPLQLVPQPVLSPTSPMPDAAPAPTPVSSASTAMSQPVAAPTPTAALSPALPIELNQQLIHSEPAIEKLIQEPSQEPIEKPIENCTEILPAHVTPPPPAPTKKATATHSANSPSPEEKKKPLSITVVGLLPGQAHMIKNEYKFIRLHFVTSDGGHGKKLTALAKSNDYVVQMIDFIRHAVGDTVRSVNDNWIYVSGGMTKLREKLTELHQRHHLGLRTPLTTAP
ncbi:MAG: hypothetical protein RLZZ612_1320 [Pseudomonadota bacterium]|jgi:hypothetical protein